MGANELMEDLSPLILWMPVVLTFLYGLYNLFKINFKLSGFFEAMRYSAKRSFRKKIHGWWRMGNLNEFMGNQFLEIIK